MVFISYICLPFIFQPNKKYLSPDLPSLFQRKPLRNPMRIPILRGLINRKFRLEAKAARASGRSKRIVY